MEIWKTIADNVKNLRGKQGLTQAALARRSSLPRSTIATIESGSANTGVSSLVKLSSALRVSLDELISRPRPRTQLIRHHEIKTNTRSGGQVLQFKLLPDPIHGMELDKFILKPKALMKGIPHIRQTREYLNCIDGEIIVTCDGEKFHLKKGDLLAFPGDVHHSYSNPGDTDASCFSTVVLAKL